MKKRREDTATAKDRKEDTATRRYGEKISGLRVSASIVDARVAPARSSPERSPRLRVSASPRRSVAPFPLITLLTDFGSSDYFAGALKGVILSVNPKARIVDITHEIPPQDIEAGAFTLLASYAVFPAQTIHICVVDPGVGSARRPILVSAGGHFFIGPDNGIFSYVLDRQSQAGPGRNRVFHLDNKKYFRHPISATFHGRDIFAPVAGALTKGVKSDVLGSEINDPVRLPPLVPDKSGKKTISARIIHIDHFGNCITNITKDDLTPETIEEGARLSINGKTIKTFRRSFANEGGDDAKLFAVWGSAGFLEIAATNCSAAKLLRAKRGEVIMVSTNRP